MQLMFRQRTHVAILAPARSFRGCGGIENPAFLVLLTPKEQRPPFDAKRKKLCGSSVTAYSAGCMENMRIYIHDKKKFRKILKDIKEKAESGR